MTRNIFFCAASLNKLSTKGLKSSFRWKTADYFDGAQVRQFFVAQSFFKAKKSKKQNKMVIMCALNVKSIMFVTGI